MHRDNSYHVITSVSDDNSAALNGFTITGGNANGSGTILVETWAVPRNIGGGTGLYQLFTRYNKPGSWATMLFREVVSAAIIFFPRCNQLYHRW